MSPALALLDLAGSAALGYLGCNILRRRRKARNAAHRDSLKSIYMDLNRQRFTDLVTTQQELNARQAKLISARQMYGPGPLPRPRWWRRLPRYRIHVERTR